MPLPRPGPTTLLGDPGYELDVVLDQYADEIEATSAALAGKLDATDAAEWGLRTHPVTGEALLPVVPNDRLTAYLYLWPGSSNTIRNGEAQIYVPVGKDHCYFGIWIGVRGKSAYAVPYITCVGLFKPGLHTLAAACTRTGSWTNTAQTGALHGAYYYATASGAKISATVTGSDLAVHQYSSTNGGYAVVTVDGSDAFDSPLPVFTSTDYANGLCRSGDVGKHYLCSYQTIAWSHTQLVATGLSSGAHLLEIEACGTKPASSTDYRIYVESLVGCGASDTVANANTHMVPVWRMLEMYSNGGSAIHSVPQWAPSGSSDYQFLTSVHADNTNCKEVSVTGPTIYVDTTDRSAAATGAYYGGKIITWYQETNASHKANLATNVLNLRRTYNAMAGRQFPILIDVTLKWLAGGVITTSYPAMLPLGAHDYPRRSLTATIPPDRVWLGAKSMTSLSANNDTTSYLGEQHLEQQQYRVLLAAYEKAIAWGALIKASPAIDQLYVGEYGAYVCVDRTDGIDKLYIADAIQTYRRVAVDDQQGYLVGLGAAFRSDLPA